MDTIVNVAQVADAIQSIKPSYAKVWFFSIPEAKTAAA
jgi:hypothetical protein